MTAPDGFPLDALDSRSDAPVRSEADLFPGSATAAVAPPDAPPVATYAVSCPARFAAAVLTLARARGIDLSALASAALMLAPDRMPDPGVPDEPDERAVLVLRLAPGLDDAAVRRALAAALALADPGLRLVPVAEVGHLEAAVETLTYRNKALAHALERVSFRPLDGPMTQVRDAAQLFGFVNEWCFDEDRVVKRFRELAPVYHPDTGVVACRERMAQLIDARNLLIRHVRTAYHSAAWADRR
ncbi:hypothetical protein [Azospirillum rugosum]|uniref:J domain-containing protein n=1 Tax=Azospirillum rugosum TaxID=416170 RepID=A0ABS4SIC7_9PROT|nr:hypothetical protein [Azospirillum rugosum]MBP2292321.1 hypothetical protein [Azospirillum rugosum]MDQ0526080.1 hypothetical protein [Azospirillum rugosum]